MRLVAVLSVSFLVLFTWHFYIYGQDKSDFPEGFDAVQAAPKSHKVIFENGFVRVLEVSVSPGTKCRRNRHLRSGIGQAAKCGDRTLLLGVVAGRFFLLLISLLPTGIGVVFLHGLGEYIGLLA